MLSVSNALKTELENGRVARFLKITLADNTTITLTSFDSDLVADDDGLTYESIPYLETSSVYSTADGTIDNQKIFSNWLEDKIDLDMIYAGEYDDAEIQIGWIGYDQASPERMVLFNGLVGEISFDDTGANIEGMGITTRLESSVGRSYTAKDPFTFGDARWQLNAGSFTKTGAVDYILSQRYKFKVTGDVTSEVDGYYSYGLLTWTSGLNAGVQSEVKVHTVAGGTIGTSFELLFPTPYTITIGDTFSTVAGYDGSIDQCKNKFNNVVNFGGFPHINPLGLE